MTATEQNASSSGDGSSMIKISNAPLAQSERNVIAVGKVIALDASAKANAIQSASFEVVDGFASGNTTIEVAPASGVPAKVDNSAGKVTLSGEASAADYDKLIQSIKLRVGNDVPANAVFRIRITLTDQSGKTESKTVTLQLNQPDQVSRSPSGAGTGQVSQSKKAE